MILTCVYRWPLIECDGLRWLEITLMRRDKGLGQIGILWVSLPLSAVKRGGKVFSAGRRRRATVRAQRDAGVCAHIQPAMHTHTLAYGIYRGCRTKTLGICLEKIHLHAEIHDLIFWKITLNSNIYLSIETLYWFCSQMYWSMLFMHFILDVMTSILEVFVLTV